MQQETETLVTNLSNPIFVICALSVTVIFIFVLNIVGFFKWIKPAFEDEFHQASYRRLIPTVLTLLCVHMILFDKIPPEQRVNVFWGCLIVGAIYAGIVTISQLYKFFVTAKGSIPPKEDLFKEDTKVQADITIKKQPEE